MNQADLMIVAVIGGCGVFAGVLTYVVLRRDLARRSHVVGAAVGCGVVVGLVSAFVVYLAVLAYLGTVVVYLVARRVFRERRTALAVGAVTLPTALAAAVWVMVRALATM